MSSAETPLLPPAPTRLGELTPFRPAARRHLHIFGAPAELVWLPERAARSGLPGPTRPAFQPSPADRILATETRWQDADFAVTPNRYPFAADIAMLWARAAVRDTDLMMLRTLLGWHAAAGGALLQNCIGASASIPRAHAHLTTETLPFLDALPESPLVADFLPIATPVQFVQKRAPFCLLGVRGDAAARTLAVHALQLVRMTAACNLVTQSDTTWLYPRSGAETPAPHFPYALGAAEVWGRWAYVRREDYERASAADLEQALVVAGMPPLA
jgi:hypothetical protein